MNELQNRSQQYSPHMATLAETLGLSPQFQFASLSAAWNGVMTDD
jgi:hypothetical protein